LPPRIRYFRLGHYDYPLGEAKSGRIYTLHLLARGEDSNGKISDLTGYPRIALLTLKIIKMLRIRCPFVNLKKNKIDNSGLILYTTWIKPTKHLFVKSFLHFGFCFDP